MRTAGPASRLTVLIGEDDTYHHHPLSHEIVRRAKQAGLAGASVFRGVEGFGASSAIHTTRILSMSEDLPLAIVIVDEEDKTREFARQLDGVIGDGLVLLDSVEAVRYQGEEQR